MKPSEMQQRILELTKERDALKQELERLQTPSEKSIPLSSTPAPTPEIAPPTKPEEELA